ncbi:MAG: choice-of-anchor D domain-containing protein [Rhodothermales bacterium]
MHTLRTTARIVLFFLLFGGGTPAAYAQVSVKLSLGSEGAPFDYFGESVAIDAGYAIVGSWLDDNSQGKDAGAAYIYRQNGPRWDLDAQLLASDGEAGDQFGVSVAIDGDVAVVGARRDDNENGPFAGAAYVYLRGANGWEEEARLVAPEGAFDDRFGSAVDVSGDRVVVGAPGFDQQRGAAYVFRRGSGGWAFEGRLEAVDGQEGDAFGEAVAIDGDYVVVGADAHDTDGLVDAGAAYIFSYTGSLWAYQATLAATTPGSDDGFGGSVSISGSSALVGSPREAVQERDEAGAAYLFVRTGTAWSLQSRLLPFTSVEGDEFGYAVHVEGGYAAVGSRWHRNNNGDKAGAVFLFERFGSAWSLETQLIAADGDVGDQFGNAVGFSNEQVIVGARWDDHDGGQDAGSAYIFPVGGSGLPALLTSTAGLTFGAVAVGQSVDGGFTVSNIGTADLNITSIAIEGADASSFQLVSGGDGALLAPLASVNATVRFSPLSPGAKTARVVLTSNAVDGPHEVRLTGQGSDGLQPGMAKVLASRGEVEPRFGSTVAVSGDYAIVGAEGMSDTDPGSAYIYRRSGETWVQQTRLLANEAAGGDRFGSAVAIDGDRAVVGAWNADDARGAAYVFVRSGSVWVQQARIQASDGLPGDRFGRAVSIDGDFMAIGALEDDNERGLGAGSVYVYARSGATWDEQTRLSGSDGRQGDRFGSAVAVRGQKLIVGAANGGFFGEGKAYVFGYDGSAWDGEGELSASDGGLSDGFGTTLAIEGDLAVVGAPIHDGDNTIDEGSAYVFERVGADWVERAKLEASDGSSGAEFGAAVAIQGEEIVVGAAGVDNQRGAAYVFSKVGEDWLFDVKISALDAANGDGFGRALGFSGNDLIVGAPDDDNLNGSDAGAVYFYNRFGLTWGQQAVVIASSRVVQPYFGAAVALGDQVAIIGASGDAESPGAAYVYVQDGASWRQAAELVASDGRAGDGFGHAVAIEGSYILVGAPGNDNENGDDAGAVYIFQQGSDSWSEQARIVASDGAAGDAFGWALVMQGDEAFIGAPADDNANGDDAGAVYAVRRNGAMWPETQTLLAGDGGAGDRFGESLAIDGVDLLVGAPNEGPFATGAGYIFRWDGLEWNPEAKLFASVGAVDDGLGAAAALDGDYAILGAPAGGDDDAGAAYVFRRSGGLWGGQEQAVLTASDGAPGYRFGSGVSISGTYVLIGADGAEEGRGAAYVLQRNGSSWLEKARLAPTDDGGEDGFGRVVALRGEDALIGAKNDSNGNGATAGSAYLIALTGQVTITAVEPEPETAPVRFTLDQNYPNPFRGATTIPFALPEAGPVSLRVFDLLGREVETLFDGVEHAGVHAVVFDASRLAAGVYFYRMQAGDATAVRRLIVVH